ncbi:hypothetical protein A6J73_13125 [Enterococcus hirae]|nr:hypothetical protein A6J73_13125 [Enterococcus hirae]OZS40447.1 hypothetical protein CHB54_11475 [Enterococcus hirae]PCE03499.1 hypothetical protein CKY13_13770 [Enterococcus hirae]PWG76419.1 hypothetical protein DF186_06570 [Enterococcus hirae]ROZ16090.1 hypothetical protein EGX06_00775 [Enterococcus hirae]
MERKKKFISSNSMYFFYIKKDTSHEFEREMCLIYLNIKKQPVKQKPRGGDNFYWLVHKLLYCKFCPKIKKSNK